MSVRLLWFTVAASLLMAPVAAQETSVLPEPFEYPPCDLPDPVRFAQLGTRLENLAFDGAGNLYVTAFEKGLYRLLPDGTVDQVGTSDRPATPTDHELSQTNAFMGVTLGSDGALYVSEGMTIVEPVKGRLLRYAVPGVDAFEVFATGFDGANGLAADSEGNLYLAHGFTDELWKVMPDGTWSLWTQVADVVNGVAAHPDGERLVIAPLGDASNTVMAIPFHDPEDREVLFRFNAAPTRNGLQLPAPERPIMTKGIDDLTVAPDGRVLISAHFRMQFVMGDPTTGDACLLLDGTRGEPSSVRIAEGFGAWDGWAFGTDFSGDVWAFDIGAGNATAPPVAGSPDPDDPQAAPGAGVLPMAVLLLAVVGLRRPRC